MLVRDALGRQVKERQAWVDQAEPRRFLVSFDVEPQLRRRRTQVPYVRRGGSRDRAAPGHA
jgi:hypothetical protein